MSIDQPRDGGKFVRTRPPTATEILAEADARRRANPDGFLIPPPVPMTELDKIINFHGKLGDEMTAQWAKNTRRLRHLKAWFAAIGDDPAATSGDLWVAWLAWKPFANGVKWSSRSWFDELDVKLRARSHVLGLRVTEEGEPAREKARQAERVRIAREAVAEAENVLLEKRALLAEIETPVPARQRQTEAA